MILFHSAMHLRAFLKEKGKSVGFVPTMGALHNGHLSLIKRSMSQNSLTVCSIFVNPTQFNDPKDLEKYPKPIEKDIELLTASACDVLFLPTVDVIYPNGISNLKDYKLGFIENFLEGASRPGHFNGVANVVDSLLQIVEPNTLYLGQKDFQQVKVIEKMLEFNHNTFKIEMCAIVREHDGLAMSSRNIRLNLEQRRNAAVIYEALSFVQNNRKSFSLPELKAIVTSKINSVSDVRVDYLEFCNANTFVLLNDWNEAEQIVCVTAVIVGDVRLLDNIILS